MTIRPKSALGLKFLQMSPGNSSEGFEAGRNDPAQGLHAGTGRHRRVLRHVRRADPARDPPEPGRLRQRPRRPRAAAQRSDRRPAPPGRQAASRCCATIVAPSTDFAGFWRALEDLSATVAPVAETQASIFVALDRTFAAFARVSRPYIQETIEKGPPTLDARNADLPALRPFLRDSARFFTALKPGAKALGDTSPVIAEALHAGVPALNASPVLNNQLTADRGSAARLPGSAGRLQRPRPADRHQPAAEARAEVHRAGADRLQLPDARLPEPRQRQQRRQRPGQLAQLRSPSSAAGRPEQRGQPGLGAPANGPNRDNHLHFNPYPNTGAPGQPNGCEAGNEKYATGQTVIGNAASSGARPPGAR